MSVDRPKIEIPLKSVDKLIELASITIILFMWVQTFLEFPNLPDTIASHFNAKGEADGFSNKGYLWIIPALALAMYIGLFFLNRYPHLHNYMVNITEDNAFEQYTFSTRVLRVVNFFIVLMFGYINYQIIEGALNGRSKLGMGFMIAVIGGSIALPVFVLIYQNRLKKKK